MWRYTEALCYRRQGSGVTKSVRKILAMPKQAVLGKRSILGRLSKIYKFWLFPADFNVLVSGGAAAGIQ